jgi:hypothetical protein
MAPKKESAKGSGSGSAWTKDEVRQLWDALGILPVGIPLSGPTLD